jgi:hypothetical protein
VLPARLDKLAEAAGLSPTERDVLVLAGSSLFERLANLRARENGSPPVPPLFEVLAIALAKPTDDIAAALAPSSKLQELDHAIRAVFFALEDAEEPPRRGLW